VLGGGLIRFGFAAPFAAAALIEFVTIVLTLRFLPQPPRRAGRTPSLREAARIVARDSAVRSLVVRHTLFIFAVTSFFAVFSLYLSRELNVGPALAALVVAYVALTFVRELGPFGAALGVAPVVGGEAIDLNPHFAGIVPAAAVALAFAIGVARMRYTGDA
jgi:predicted MFS family arabinose efflux permease